MGIEVCKGIEIINYDDKELENIKKTCTFDNGAIQVLEALNFLIDDLLDRYEYENDIPYRKIFDVLKHVIQGACNREVVRDALITGLVVQKKQQKENLTSTPKKAEKKDIQNSQENVFVNKIEQIPQKRSFIRKDEFIAYAKDHTIPEISSYFELSPTTVSGYIYRNKIDYKRIHVQSSYLERIKELAQKNLTCAEIARLLGCSKVNVHKVAKNYNIKLYKKTK